MGIENITVFADASFCPDTHAAGGAFWARSDQLWLKRAFPLEHARQSHEAEVMVACTAILQLAEHPEFHQALAKGRETRLVLVIDCLTVQHVLGEGRDPPFSAAAAALVSQVRRLKQRLGFWLKVNHVKGHSGTRTPRQWVNHWCDKQAYQQMAVLRQQRQPPEAVQPD